MFVKLLFDQNLSYRLVGRLKASYPDATHVETLGLDTASDKELWEYAKTNGFTIVTKDSDFNELCTLYDFPPHIIWLRLGNSRVSVAEEALVRHRQRICDIVKENETGIIEVT